jgi:hypothetical protein
MYSYFRANVCNFSQTELLVYYRKSIKWFKVFLFKASLRTSFDKKGTSYKNFLSSKEGNTEVWVTWYLDKTDEEISLQRVLFVTQKLSCFFLGSVTPSGRKITVPSVQNTSPTCVSSIFQFVFHLTLFISGCQPSLFNKRKSCLGILTITHGHFVNIPLRMGMGGGNNNLQMWQ